MIDISSRQEPVASVIDSEHEFTALYEAYNDRCDTFQSLSAKHRKGRSIEQAFWGWHNSAVALFNAFEKIISLGAITGADQNLIWFSDKADTAVNLLEIIALHFETVRIKVEEMKLKEGFPQPSPTAFASIQRLANRSSPEHATMFRSRFVAIGLPTHGFDKDCMAQPKSHSSRTSGTIGVSQAAAITITLNDHSMNINNSNLQGSNVAGEGASITGSTASFANNTDLVEALKALKPLLQGVAAEERKTLEAALQTLVISAENDSIGHEQTQSAAETVVAASPELKEKVKGIFGKIGLSLVGSTIFQVFKSALGIH